MITAQRLATELATRLDPCVPDGFRVSAHGPVVALHAPDGSRAHGEIQWFLADPGDPRDNITTAVWSTLQNFQDTVIEQLTHGWPGPEDASAADLPLPGSRITDGRIELWYGKEGDPTDATILFDPIPLDS